MLNKEKLRHVDLAQDAGNLIADINNIRVLIPFQVNIKLVKKKPEVPNFMINSAQYMIHICDKRSKEKRIEMENTEESVTLPKSEVTIKTSVHEYIREYAAEQSEIKVINECFKEYTNMVDQAARRNFKYATTSIIKCCYGFVFLVTNKRTRFTLLDARMWKKSENDGPR